jgi:hypothetical protein
MSTQTHLAALELKRRRLLVKDEIACLQRDVTPPSPISELRPAVKPKTASRAVRLQSSSWYAGAARSIAIHKPKRF